MKIEEVAYSQSQLQHKKRQRVGILGGTFNPVHQGHLIIADQVRDKLQLDQVYLMPTNIPPHKAVDSMVTNQQRLNMLALAIADNPSLAIEDIEMERETTSYTYDTMDILTHLNPHTDYYFIIGADMIESLDQWYRIDDLIKLVNFVGVARPGYSIETDYPIMLVDTAKIDLSSSQIRQAVKAGAAIRYLVPEAVRQYIIDKELYHG
nr:nicotinate-nucleotide adenylyltransferase [Aerococcus urinaehominis]